MQRSIVIGASAGLGRELTKLLALRNHQLFLVASDVRDLEPLAKDLNFQFGSQVDFLEINLETFTACFI